MRNELTQDRLKEVVHYSKKTGLFTWKEEGTIAGYIDSFGYTSIMIDYVDHWAQRLAYLYVKGYFPEHIIDHKDRVRTNNRWKNLRQVSHECNMRNKGLRRNNKSGMTGVCCVGSSFQVSIHSGKYINLGRYKTFDEAVMARWIGEIKCGWRECIKDSPAYLHLRKIHKRKYLKKLASSL